VEYRRLGRTNLRVSILGLGSGGKSQLGQAHGMAQDQITPIVRRALDLGVNIIDTSPDYANSEALLGTALADVPRDSYVMCTKFWPVRNEPSGQPLPSWIRSRTASGVSGPTTWM
jgi:L-galactose dehydrogenase